MIATPLKLWAAIGTATLLISGLVFTAPKGRHGDAVAETKPANAVGLTQAPAPEPSNAVPEDVFGPNFWAPLGRDDVN